MRVAALTLLLLAARPGAAVETGKRAPVTIVTAAQLKHAIKQHKGRVVVLHLWATWCDACMEELPLVGRLAQEANPRGIDVLSFSLDDPTDRAAAQVGKVLDERGSEVMSRAIVRVDDPDAFVAGIDPKWEGSIPAFFAYDRQGKLRRALVGELTRAGFDQFVADLVK